MDLADSDTLVVFDVDEVLITFDDLILRPCGKHFTPASWKGIYQEELDYLTSIIWNESKTILVDPSAPELVNKLVNRGVKVIALTACPTGDFGIIEKIEDWRLKILKRLNIDFSNTFPKNQVIYFDDGDKKERDYPLFKEGILFIGNGEKTKGDLLVQFFEEIQWYPSKVIFIDDRMYNLTSVESALNKIKILYQGYHYKGMENLPNNFNEQIAEFQFFHLRKEHKWLSDLEAEKKTKHSSPIHQ
jgi:hypothetical protein